MNCPRTWYFPALCIIAMTVTASIPHIAVAQSSLEEKVRLEIVHEGTAHRPLFGIDFDTTGQLGMGVGAFGTIIETVDGGRNWTKTELPGVPALLGVAVSRTVQLAVGQSGTILRRVADGVWEPVDSAADERFLAVALAAEHGLAVAVGGFGLIRISTDLGETWQEPPEPFSSFIEEGYDPHLYSAAITASGDLVVAGEFGLVAVSSDQGETWQVVHRGDETIANLVVADGVRAVAVGQRGLLLVSSDVGATWARIDAGSQANLLGVAVNSAGQIIVPGMRHMLWADDLASGFSEVSVGDVNVNWYISAAASGGDFFVVGHTGRIIRIARN